MLIVNHSILIIRIFPLIVAGQNFSKGAFKGKNITFSNIYILYQLHKPKL
jgi:hypothetical protein